MTGRTGPRAIHAVAPGPAATSDVVEDEQPPSSAAVRVRAPGKVNLDLHVDALGDDGYHRLVTVFQAVSLVEEVEVSPSQGLSISVSGPQAELVPIDSSNIAWRAAELVAQRVGIEPDVHVHLRKGVPVAGGMAGGSADGAATLLACDTLWGAGLGRAELLELAAELGSDVPFGLLGHTAVGTGRGHLLTPAMTRGAFHWAFGLRHEGMSTRAVYDAFDARCDREGPVAYVDEPQTAMMQALRAGDATALGACLRNDLQDASLELNPALGEVMDVARGAGALGVMVSGSGPTVAALARSPQHALAIAAALTAANVVDDVATAVGNAPGARVVSGR